MTDGGEIRSNRVVAVTRPHIVTDASELRRRIHRRRRSTFNDRWWMVATILQAEEKEVPMTAGRRETVGASR